jgi:quinohemoprotein amine dehydrogenase
MWIAPDQSAAEGRWFWGSYQEFGFDVKLRRASSDPTLTSAGSIVIEDRYASQPRPTDR